MQVHRAPWNGRSVYHIPSSIIKHGLSERERECERWSESTAHNYPPEPKLSPQKETVITKKKKLITTDYAKTQRFFTNTTVSITWPIKER
ncbi:hypothetical protein CEXT_401171 [Caerostris extrusa]|uniref:Uncharacterized protein n=1 Tax=Caerostris extrusa TaxID=172846 RepID=A0AAV4PXL8_CAEEX|nr:hypothetical protein CEXT_401171 [Caerostris extrusa]